MTEEHHSTEQQLIDNRIEKMARFRERGDEPFKYRFERTCSIADARAAFEAAEAGSENPEQVTVAASVAGRMVALRGQGKVTFADLRDESGRIQVFFRSNELGDDAYERLKDLDIGDFLGMEGEVFRTRRGEVTVRAVTYTLLAKSLRPLPEKWHGLTDVETRYRQRYLDMVANPEVLETFRRRSRIIATLRHWLTARGFLEVETPMLHRFPAARPRGRS